MTEKEILALQKFEKFIFENDVSNDFLVQIIELAGGYLNLMTISDYAKSNKLSYNGVKKFRETKEIFNVKFVIDNN
jgi:hypothetical protein